MRGWPGPPCPAPPSCWSADRWSACRSYGHGGDRDGPLRRAVTRAVLVVGARGGDLLHDVHALGDRPHHGVAGRQRVVPVTDEELGPVRAGSRVRRRDGAFRVRRRLALGQVLVVVLVARAAGAGAGRVTALQYPDALGGEPVTRGPVVEMLAGQVPERRHRAGRPLPSSLISMAPRLVLIAAIHGVSLLIRSPRRGPRQSDGPRGRCHDRRAGPSGRTPTRTTAPARRTRDRPRPVRRASAHPPEAARRRRTSPVRSRS